MRLIALPPQSILDKNKDLGNYEKHLPLRDCFLAGIFISGLTKERCNTLLFALARVCCDSAAAMASKRLGVSGVTRPFLGRKWPVYF